MPEKDGFHEMMAFGTAFSGAGLFWMGKRRQGASEPPSSKFTTVFENGNWLCIPVNWVTLFT